MHMIETPRIGYFLSDGMNSLGTLAFVPTILSDQDWVVAKTKLRDCAGAAGMFPFSLSGQSVNATRGLFSGQL